MNDDLTSLDKLTSELERIQTEDRLGTEYELTHDDGGIFGSPYPWQVEFHTLGYEDPERAIIAANQTGKTRTAAAEIAIHTTGRYPPWWRGRRYSQPSMGIVAGMTNEDVRDIQQLALIGEIDENRRADGSGWIPRECIGGIGFRQCGVPNVVDTVRVKHASGGWSVITFKSYEQKATKFQGRTVDWCWLDEEPDDYQIFSECQTRTMVKKGMVLFTNTPLKGMSKIVKHFLNGGKGISYVTATWGDALHLSEEEKAERTARYDEYERDTRTKGVPMMGTGLVYPIPSEMYLTPPFPIPAHFRRICGIDFGIDHPGAAAWLAHDADLDILYLYDCYRERGKTPAYHAQAIMGRGRWIPVAWPHDGMQRDKGSGIPLAHQYRTRGVNMLVEPASWDSEFQSDRGAKAQSREAGNSEILERMHTGRFFVVNCNATAPFLEELRMLHRKEGQIVAVADDIESAVRYAVMMLRFAVSDDYLSIKRPTQQDNNYNPLDAFSRRHDNVFSSPT